MQAAMVFRCLQKNFIFFSGIVLQGEGGSELGCKPLEKYENLNPIISIKVHIYIIYFLLLGLKHKKTNKNLI